jgi:ADP-heptose:LPS heptosyltransferase
MRILLNIINKFSIRRNNSLLLLKTDEIGDYILFRNFIEALKKDGKYKKYNITLCGNIVWKDLCCKLDNNFISRYIWINKEKFTHSYFYRFFFLVKIHFRRYDLLVHSTYSRDEISDELVREFQAEVKIGSSGDLSNIQSEWKKISDTFYTTLIPASDNPMFEFYRNKDFFEKLLGYPIDKKKPYCRIEDIRRSKRASIKEKYVLICPGSGHSTRRWSIKNFDKVIGFLLENYDYDIVIAGNHTDRKIVRGITHPSNKRIHNLAGLTPLSQLVLLIYQAELVITHDTSSVHISAMFDKKTVCLSNGNYYGRFVPYPKGLLNNYHLVLIPEIDPNSDDDVLMEDYKRGSLTDINSIHPEEVIKKVATVLSSAIG